MFNLEKSVICRTARGDHGVTPSGAALEAILTFQILIY